MNLGIDYSKKKTRFRVWAPRITNIDLLLYGESHSVIRKVYPMKKQEDGTHFVDIYGDLKNKFYTYLVEGKDEVTDPYSYAISLNSVRSAIVDLSETNPKGWETHKVPYTNNLCKSIIYEVHIKDFTIDKSSGVKYRGKYLGFVEEGTKYNNNSTGLDHLKDLGITHVHLMPVNDFLTVKEEKEYFYNKDNYNWGYDPEHYNAVEGSYSLTPEDPKARIIELKTLIMKLHESGIKVVLDVVYNHTYRSEKSNFNVLNPGYYYRNLKDGSFSNGSGCGNEIATEREMVRAFIKDSLKYWLLEYKVDGFRFDLMSLMDMETTEKVVNELKSLKKDILIYGEPWTGGKTTLSDSQTTSKGTQGNKGFAFFNDDFREAIKGDNDGYEKGFAQGNIDGKNGTETGIVGSIYYDDAHIGFTSSPSETINYVNSHDNLILHDKLVKVFPNSSQDEIIKYNKFAMSILFTSQGITFIHAGNEFLRSKGMVANSYKSDISINAIDWSLKEKNIEFYNYMKELIQIKKYYREFSMTSKDEIIKKIKFFDTELDENLIAYTIKRGESKNYLLIIHNGNLKDKLLLTTNIKKHIEYHYHKDNIQIELKKVFGLDGWVRQEIIRWHPHGIVTKDLSTAIWDIEVI